MAMKFEKIGEAQYALDVTGYVCPHPQLYTKQVLKKLWRGDVVKVMFDNPSSSESIEAMCAAEGNMIVEKNMVDGRFTWKIKKG